MPMTTKTKDWKKKWFGVATQCALPDKHPVYSYDTMESLNMNYSYHWDKLNKVTVQQLLNDPDFTYLMLPFIQNHPYFHWTRAELEARKDEIFGCDCCDDKSVLGYMSVGELFSFASNGRKFFDREELFLSTGVIIHTK